MLIKYIKSDLYRYAGNTSFKAFLKNYFFNRGFNFTFWFRVYQNGNAVTKKIVRLIVWHKTRKYKIQIPMKTKIGYGLYIGHGGPLVINPTAIIGNNVNLSQFITIGANNGKAAEIGDNVYIGPNVCIVENIKVGSNVCIGAGSVVTKDIPSNSTAAGNYAKVLNNQPNLAYIQNKWIDVH